MNTEQPHSSCEFWGWFRLTAEAIALTPHDSALLAGLDVRAQRLHPKLSWEIGPDISKPWQLRELAKSIVAASPALRDWEFHSARQTKKWDFRFELEDPKGRDPIELDASTWKFVLLKYPDGKNEVLLKAEAQTRLTKEQRNLAATIVLESILGGGRIMKSLLLALVLVFLLPSSSTVVPAFADSRVAAPISMIQVLANPQEFDGSVLPWWAFSDSTRTAIFFIYIEKTIAH